MAHLVLTEPRIYLGSYDITTDTKDVSLDIAVPDLDDSHFGSTWNARLAGVPDASLNFSGSLELTDDGQDETTFGYVGGSDTTVSVAAQYGLGNVGYGFKSLLASYSLLGAHGEIAPISGSALGQSRAFRGTQLHLSDSAVTGTGTGTAFNVGAVSSTQRLYATLHVVSASGITPTLDVTIESDDAEGFPSAVTRLTFTQATGKTHQFASVAGPITDTWFRVKHTIGGTDPSFRYFVLVGVAT